MKQAMESRRQTQAAGAAPVHGPYPAAGWLVPASSALLNSEMRNKEALRANPGRGNREEGMMAVVSEKKPNIKMESLSFLRDPVLRAKLENGEALLDMDRAEFDLLAAHLKPVSLERNAVLFREGDMASYMGVVLEGKLYVHKRGDDNINKELYTMTPGKIFGEMALLDGEPRSATLVAGEPTLVAILSREAFDRLCRERPAIALKIMLRLGRLLSQRLRRVSGLLVDHLP